MEAAEIISGVYHLNFPTQQVLASTFLRFQEHYESPQFRDKIFSLDEFRKWYIANSENGKKTGKFTYYEDWTGFNIPSYVLAPFYQGLFDPLSEPEKSFLKIFADKKEAKFYVIGTFGDCRAAESALEHEIAHGLFYIDEGYKLKVLRILAAVKPEDKARIRTHFMDGGGYDEKVIEDEMHAHLATEPEYFTGRSLMIDDLPKVHRQLRKIFDAYFDKHTKK
ncbi:MAG: ABC transporter ATP-binding protein [Nanoarchaeota archaeon]